MLSHDWTVVSSTKIELTCLDSCGCFDANFLNPFSRQAVSMAVSISKWPRWLVECFEIQVFNIGGVVSAHPAAVIVVTNIRKRKSETCIASEIPTFSAV